MECLRNVDRLLLLLILMEWLNFSIMNKINKFDGILKCSLFSMARKFPFVFLFSFCLFFLYFVKQTSMKRILFNSIEKKLNEFIISVNKLKYIIKKKKEMQMSEMILNSTIQMKCKQFSLSFADFKMLHYCCFFFAFRLCKMIHINRRSKFINKK